MNDTTPSAHWHLAPPTKCAVWSKKREKRYIPKRELTSELAHNRLLHQTKSNDRLL